MKKILLFISLIFIVSSNISGQISAGFNIEPYSMSGVGGTEGLSLLSVSASLAYKFDSTKSISFRTGVYGEGFDVGIFRGSNYTLYGQYYVNGTIYLLAGLGLHKNDATAPLFFKITNRLVTLISFGLGIKPLTWLHIENIFLLPVKNRDFATIYDYRGTPFNNSINYLYKLSIGIELEI